MGASASTPETTTQPELQPPTYSDGQRIKSLSSVSRVACVFHNHTPFALNMMWLNYLGDPVSYGMLRAGTHKIMYTYNTHPWVFRSMDEPEATPFIILRGSKKQVLFPSCDRRDYHVELADSLTWSPALHARHWKHCHQFKAQVQTLLLCQNKMQKLVPSPSSSRGSSRPGSPACGVLSCLPMDAHSPSGHASRSPSPDDGVEHKPRSSSGGHVSSLQDVPYDLLLLIIRYLAPRVPDVVLSEPSDMQLPPESLMAQHIEAAAAIQEQLANPGLPPE